MTQHNKLGNNITVTVIGSTAVNNQNTRIAKYNFSETSITRLLVELAQCSPTLTNFHYSWGNPIDSIPPNVQRWLRRFQEQQNAPIY